MHTVRVVNRRSKHTQSMENSCKIIGIFVETLRDTLPRKILSRTQNRVCVRRVSLITLIKRDWLFFKSKFLETCCVQRLKCLALETRCEYNIYVSFFKDILPLYTCTRV